MAENGHFLVKKTHRSAARTPICHIVPISRVYPRPPPLSWRRPPPLVGFSIKTDNPPPFPVAPQVWAGRRFQGTAVKLPLEVALPPPKTPGKKTFYISPYTQI